MIRWALLLLAFPCFAITPVTAVNCAAPAATTSCTLGGTPQYGDLLISVNGDTTTLPTLVAGWTSISGTAATRSLRVSYKFSQGNETTCGTWTNATISYCMDYRGADIASTGPYGGTSTATATSATLAYNTITMTRANGTSWVLGCAWTNAATNADVAPSGMTLRSGTSNAAFACSDTNGGVSSWATTNVTITNVAHRSIVVELLASPPKSSIAGYVVQNVLWSHVAGDSETGNGFVLTLPNATMTNNFLHLIITASYSATPPTVSSVTCNSGGGTWVAGTNGGGSGVAPSYLNTTDKMNTWSYTITGATAGCSAITVTLSASPVDFTADFHELTQIATSSAFDGTSVGALASWPYITAGPITTTTNNDLILQYCTNASNGIYSGGPLTGIFEPAGSTFLTTDRYGSIASQAFIQTTAAAISPYMEADGQSAGNDVNCVAMALKTSPGAGTPIPAGIRVINRYLIESNEENSNPYVMQVPINVQGLSHLPRS